MKQTSITKRPPLLDVVLREEDHVYLDSQKRVYDSVTTIIGNYKEKFDPYKIMKNGKPLIVNYVAKNGGTLNYWLDKWDENRQHKALRGSIFHNLKEENSNNSSGIYKERKFLPVRSFREEIEKKPEIDYSQLPSGIYNEIAVFHRMLRISGTIDKLIIYDDRTFDIDDYKTNGNFETKSFYSRGKYKKMFFPLNGLMDCHLGHYTMQLSLYAWILKQYGLTPRRLRLLHFQITDEMEKNMLNNVDVEKIEYTIYGVNYEEKLVARMLKDYRTKFPVIA